MKVQQQIKMFEIEDIETTTEPTEDNISYKLNCLDGVYRCNRRQLVLFNVIKSITDDLGSSPTSLTVPFKRETVELVFSFIERRECQIDWTKVKCQEFVKCIMWFDFSDNNLEYYCFDVMADTVFPTINGKSWSESFRIFCNDKFPKQLEENSIFMPGYDIYKRFHECLVEFGIE